MTSASASAPRAPTGAETPVRFYGKGRGTARGQNGWDASYRWLSNFYGTITSLLGSKDIGGSSFCWNERLYQSVESAFQASKYLDSAPHIAEAIRACPYGAIVYAMGRASSSFAVNTNKSLSPASKAHYLAMIRQARATGLAPGWEERKESVMEELLWLKFSSNAPLARQLLATGERRIVEASPVDSFWGEGPAGDGANRMGVLLARVRRRLREGGTPSDPLVRGGAPAVRARPRPALGSPYQRPEAPPPCARSGGAFGLQ